MDQNRVHSRAVRLPIALLALVLAASAVAGPAPAVGRYTGAAEPAITVGFLTNAYSRLGDNGFNDAVIGALTKAKSDFGIGVVVRESAEETAYASNIALLVGEGADLVFSDGLLSDPMVKKAKEHPNARFAILDGFVDKPPANLVGISFKAQEAAYLAGVLAARSTRSDFDTRLNAANTIAFVGGMDVPAVQLFEAGYVAGARLVDPRVKVIGAYANSFTDEGRGEEIAGDAIADGADVVFAAAGGASKGVLKACREKGALYIGVDTDEYVTNPGSGNVILTSVVKDYGNAVYSLVKSVVTEDSFAGGRNVSVGLEREAVGLAPYHDFESHVPTSVRVGVAQARSWVASGIVAVPTTRAELRKVVVGNPVTPKSMSRSKTYSISGLLKPRHLAGTRPVRIYKWRKVGRTWKAYGYVTARVSDYSAHSRYAQSVRLPYAGTWRLRAYHPADAQHSAVWSSGYANVLVK